MAQFLIVFLGERDAVVAATSYVLGSVVISICGFIVGQSIACHLA